MEQRDNLREFWLLPEDQLLRALRATPNGLSANQAQRRLNVFGLNEIKTQSRVSRLSVFLRQVRSPLLLILAFAAVVSLGLGEWQDATVVAVILLGSVGLGFSREYRAQSAAEKLKGRLRPQSRVLRDGKEVVIESRMFFALIKPELSLWVNLV